MLWLLLRTAGYDFNPCDYSDCENELKRNNRIPNSLDPIECAGAVFMDALKKVIKLRRWKPALLMVMLLDNPEKFLVEQVPAKRRVWTRKKYQPHFMALKASKIISELDAPNSCRYYSTYFSVPKTSKEDRAIFNGRLLSMCFRRPPPVNLIRMPDLLQKLAVLAKSHPGLCVASGDLRHWFHQLSAGKALSSFFGVACAGASFKWNTLPMGFSWSPFLAQVASWMFLTHKNPWVEEACFADEQLPTFVELRGGGWMTVYYDNYIIAAVDAKQLCSIEAVLRSNCEEFNIVLKCAECFSP